MKSTEELNKERNELYNQIIQAQGYVEELFNILDDVAYGKCQQNADLFDSFCKTEKFMITDARLMSFYLLKHLTMYKNLIESQQ